MNKFNFEKEREEQLKLLGKNKKMLLHACCAPCSTACLERLAHDFRVTVYFYNPNMDTRAEFEKRADEMKRFLLEAYGDSVGLVVENYDPNEFYDCVCGFEKEPEGGARCEKCFRLRLGRTARYAVDNGFDCFTTTLTVSPHKNAPLINGVGQEAAEETGVEWIFSDFKKAGGFLRSTEISAKYGLYRQNYCGCVFSRLTKYD